MSDKIPKKVKVPKALRKAGIDTLLETTKGRAILAEALLAAASAAAAVLTAPRAGDKDTAGGEAGKAAQPAGQGAAGKRSIAIVPASRRRVGRPRTAPPTIASDKAPSPPTRITPTAPAAGRKAAGTPVPRQRAATAKAQLKTSAAVAGTESAAKTAAPQETAAKPNGPAANAGPAKPAARRGRPARKSRDNPDAPKT